MTLPFHTRETQAGFFVKESLFLRISLGDSPTRATETDAFIYFITLRIYFLNITETIRPNF